MDEVLLCGDQAGGCAHLPGNELQPAELFFERPFGLNDDDGGCGAPCASGTAVAELRYKPWGETRLAGGTTPSKYQFTGQYNESELGLYYYNARWYDGYLNHFTQPDSIIPNPYNSADYDRYSYTRNNPVKYSDPSGHRVTAGCGDGRESCGATEREKAQAEYQRQRGDGLKCQAGNTTYCSYAENHPVETLGYGFGGLILASVGTTVVATTSTIVESFATISTTLESTNIACGNDFCASELVDTNTKVNNLVNQAQVVYPKLAGKINLHHIFPKYLGGDPNGPVTALDAAYHQLITNEFRALWDYGQSVPSLQKAEEIMWQVYSKFPLPK